MFLDGQRLNKKIGPRMTPMKRKLLIDNVVNLIKSIEEACGVENSKGGGKCYNSYKACK